MKALLFSISCLLLITACSKSSVTPTPEAASVVAGTYPLTYIESDSASVVLYKYNLPYTVGTNTLSGSLTARRDSASVVYITETIKATGYGDQTQTIGQVRLQANGTGYDMYQQNLKIGTADGTSINIDAQYTDPQRGTKYRDVITAHK